MPIFPLLALLSAEQINAIFLIISNKLERNISLSLHFYIKILFWLLLLIVFSLSTIAYTNRNLDKIAIDPIERENILKREVSDYAVVQYLNIHPYNKIYNIGLYDFKYYLNRPLWGDVFGTWRESDIYSTNPSIFYKNLNKNGFDSVVLPKSYVEQLRLDDKFNALFNIKFETDNVFLLEIKMNNL
jgi:hypothetical protein